MRRLGTSFLLIALNIQEFKAPDKLNLEKIADSLSNIWKHIRNQCIRIHSFHQEKNGGSKTQGISLKHTEKCVQYKPSNRDQRVISTCWVSNKTKVIVQYLQKYNLRQEDLKRKKTKLFN